MSIAHRVSKVYTASKERWSPGGELSAALQTLDIIFYGDSITESWRGLQVGVPVEKFKGIPEIFAKAYGGVKAAAYSISGIPFHFTPLF